MDAALASTPPLADASASVRPAHFFADLYAFSWSAVEYRLPAVSAAAVGLCLATGILCGHPGAALVAGGGALNVGFGANQRIRDSRVMPMVLALVLTALATLIGTLAGHHGYTLLVASALSAAVYGVLTVRNAGLAWVGQQVSISLFVASAFPTGPKLAFERAGLIALGGLVQAVMTSAALRLMPELRTDLLAIPRNLYQSVYQQRAEFLRRLRHLPQAMPAPQRSQAIDYAVRLSITVVLATELYRRLGIQSGYWIPMVALVVQKPAFFETLARALARMAGTLAGATLATVLVARLLPGPWWLAALATLFAFWAFATIRVNYALYSLCLTSYLVFLLSLNVAPGPEIARRRALCTAAGALIALVIHIDGLVRHRKTAGPVG